MLEFTVSAVVTTIREILLDADLGVESAGKFHVHETLASAYLQTVQCGVLAVLREALCLDEDTDAGEVEDDSLPAFMEELPVTPPDRLHRPEVSQD